MSSTTASEYLRRAPKVELHVHLEGALRPERLFHILRRHARRPEIARPEDLAFLYRHRDFREFLDHFRWATTSLGDVQDVHDVALDLCRELSAQNVVYAEIIFSASVFVRMGMDLGALLDAVSDAAATAEAEHATASTSSAPAPRFNFVLDLVRNFGPEEAERFVAAVVARPHPRVVGVHLGGDEAGFPARIFERAFARARDAGLGLAAHAGEGDGASSVRDALQVLGVTRIGHGIRSLEDPSVVAEIVGRQATLEVCPTSNVCTGIVARLEEHPLPALLAAGVQATLGADDPSYFGTDLTAEWRAVHEKLGLDLDRLDDLCDAGLEAAFLPALERRARGLDVASRRATLRTALGMPRSSG